MATLSDKHKLFIVIRLATFHTPSEVVVAVKQEFGVDTTRQQIQFYNPEGANGSARLSEGWKKIFYEVRHKYVEEPTEHAISKKGFRMGSLQKLHDYYWKNKITVRMESVLRQAAEEMGGKYEVDPDGGKSEGNTMYQLVQHIEQQIIENRQAGQEVKQVTNGRTGQKD